MSNADAVIAALRSGYDSLAGIVRDLSDEQLAGPTGAAEWDVSQVLSHLGSGAEIGQNTLHVSLEGKPNPGLEFNKTIWARYDNASRRERLEWFLAANEALIQSYESLSDEVRDTLRIDMGFLPAPVDVATACGFRLSEFALHSWDVRAGTDPAATVAPEATPILLQRLPMLAVIAVTTTDPAQDFTVDLGEKASIIPGAPEQSDGALTLPAEAFVRLIVGRLKPQYTPADITATGSADLEIG